MRQTPDCFGSCEGGGNHIRQRKGGGREIPPSPFAERQEGGRREDLFKRPLIHLKNWLLPSSSFLHRRLHGNGKENGTFTPVIRIPNPPTAPPSLPLPNLPLLSTALSQGKNATKPPPLKKSGEGRKGIS